MKSRLMIAIIAALSIAGAPVWGQCNTGIGLLNKLCTPGSSPKALALTTGFSDAGHPETLSPSLDSKAFDSLEKLRANSGGYVLAPGLYQAYLECFVLDPGAPGASGFYPVPVRGSKAATISGVLKRADAYPDVSHDAIQELLLGIVQGTDVQKMSPQGQQAAATLLTKDQIAQLHISGGGKRAMDWVGRQIARNTKAQAVLNNVQNGVNQQDQKYGVSDTVGSLQDGESASSSQPSAPALARGTWIHMSGGYYLRYLSEGSGRIRVQILVPTSAVESAAQVTFDPTDYIALSGGSPAVRLGISSRPAEKRE